MCVYIDGQTPCGFSSSNSVTVFKHSISSFIPFLFYAQYFSKVLYASILGEMYT
jgi:hypothetical protein